jgi:uncharacterized damage-inducible protein DinB
MLKLADVAPIPIASEPTATSVNPGFLRNIRKAQSAVHVAARCLHQESHAYNIVRMAEKMPEENYGMRPGAQTEVRTFGQQVTHVATFNFLWCSQAKGEKNPSPGNLDKLTSKADILKVLNDAFAYCDGAYSALTDASGAEVIDITQENGRQTRNLRMGLLTLNYGHNNEIYGSMVVYLRMKNIVPPASEPRPQPSRV